MNEDQNFEIIVSAPSIDLNQLEEPKEQQTGFPIGVESNVAAQVVRTPLIAPRCNENLHAALGPKGKINHLPNIFLKMAQEAAALELPTATLVIGMYNDHTKGVLPGQYVTELHLVIHRMPDDKKVEESLPVSGQ